METPVKTWNVKFFQNARGESPVEDFIKAQDERTYAKILTAISLLKQGGPFLKPPFIKKLQDKLYELRISGASAIRIFYTMRTEEYFLLHGFKKKSQKTPPKELKIAMSVQNRNVTPS